MNRKDLQTLARTRLAEAKALLSAGLPDGAYYLAGYAVECALKACIAKRTQRHDFPEKKSVDASYTHNLKDLIKVARLESERLKEAEKDAVFLRAKAVTWGMIPKERGNSWKRSVTGDMG